MNETPQIALELDYVFGKVHPLVTPCWLIRIADMDQLMMVHKWVCSRLAQKYGMDPHMAPEIEKESLIGVLYNPVVLGAKWLSTATQFLFDAGRVFINPSGGIAPDVQEITSEVEQRAFPINAPISGEVVYISKWPDGRHFYLRSSKERLFPFDKLNSEREATVAAGKYAPGAAIKFVEPKRVYRTEGD